MYGHWGGYGSVHDSNRLLREVRPSIAWLPQRTEPHSDLDPVHCRVTAIEADRIQDQQKLSNLNYDLEATWQKRR